MSFIFGAANTTLTSLIFLLLEFWIGHETFSYQFQNLKIFCDATQELLHVSKEGKWFLWPLLQTFQWSSQKPFEGDSNQPELFSRVAVCFLSHWNVSYEQPGRRTPAICILRTKAALNLPSFNVRTFFCLRQLGFSPASGIARWGKLLSVLKGDLCFSLKPHFPLWFKNRVEPHKASLISGFHGGY